MTAFNLFGVSPSDPHHFDNPVYAYPEKTRHDPLPLPPNIPVQKNDLGGATSVKQVALDEEEGERGVRLSGRAWGHRVGDAAGG